MKRKMYHFPETRMHKNGRPRVLGDTFPVMKEMKEKNLHRGPHAPGRLQPLGEGAEENSVSYQLLEKMKEKSIICFIRTVGV